MLTKKVNKNAGNSFVEIVRISRAKKLKDNYIATFFNGLLAL